MNLLKINLILVGLLLCSMRAGALSKSEIADLDGHIILGNRKSGGKLFIFGHNQDEWTSPLWSYNTRVGVDGLSMDFNHFNDQKRVWYKNTEHILIAGNGDGIALFNLETEKFDFSYEVKVDGLSTSVHAAEILPDGNFVVADPTGANRGGANLRLIYGDNADPKILQSIAFSGIHAVVWDYERERLWVWGSKLRKYRYVSDGENSQLIQDGSQFSPPWWGSGAHDMMPMVRDGESDQLIFNCQQGIGTFDIESESFELLYGTNSVAVNVLPDSKVVRGKGVDHNSLTGEVIYNKSEASKLYKPGTIINSKMDSWDYTGTDTMEFYKAHWFQHNTFSYGPRDVSTNPPPAVINSVSNGSFESGGDTPSGWTYQNGATAVRTNTVVHEGAASLLINQISKPVLQIVPTTVGRTYELSVWINASGLTGGKVVLDTTNLYDDAPENCQFVVSSPNGGWEKYSGTFAATNSSVKLRIFATDSAFSGEVYFDAVVLEEIGGGLTGYEIWADEHGMGEPLADDDSNGWNNFLEYAVGERPVVNASNYVHRQRVDDATLLYQIETCSNLVSNDWNQVTVADNTNAVDGTYEEVLYSLPINQSQNFIRLNVSYP
jgi:hypothetical protein